jgi:methyl-accepting chemotaxis protein
MAEENSDHAGESRQLNGSTSASLDQVAEGMTTLSATMAEIEEGSGATARILQTIDEIAFQTNLLALNAAVEAARAGEAGAGFAVVADEVRALALRSAEASRQTAELVERSVTSVKTGVKVTGMVAGHLEEVREHAVRSLEVAEEISGASTRQRSAVQEISSSVQAMNIVVQRTAANGEETAGTAVEMSGQGDELSKLVRRFTLRGRRGGDAPSVVDGPEVEFADGRARDHRHGGEFALPVGAGEAPVYDVDLSF